MGAISIEMEILLRAIQWEGEGYQIYNSLSRSLTDKKHKEFFSNLAFEEVNHRNWLEERLKEVCEQKEMCFDKVIKSDLKDLTLKPLARTPFQNDNLINHFPDPMTFPVTFEFAIGHEYKTIEIYEELFNIIPQGPTSLLIQKLIEYEKEHIKSLQEEKAGQIQV